MEAYEFDLKNKLRVNSSNIINNKYRSLRTSLTMRSCANSSCKIGSSRLKTSSRQPGTNNYLEYKKNMSDGDKSALVREKQLLPRFTIVERCRTKRTHLLGHASAPRWPRAAKWILACQSGGLFTIIPVFLIV